MPTKRGWLLLAGAVVLTLGGRVLGVAELLTLAAACAALVAVGLAYVHLPGVGVEAQRLLRPASVVAGESIEVQIVVENRMHRRSPLLAVYDRGPARRSSPRVVLAPLGRNESARARYRLGVAERGIHHVGPLVVVRTDPFGAATWSTLVLGPSTLVALPHFDEVSPPPSRLADQLAGGPLDATRADRGQQDFATLRPYVEGDDLRLVHWASTAKYGELVVRQEEAAPSRCTTVLLDLRQEVHSPASVEASVSATAAVVAACARHGASARVLTTSGLDTTATSGGGFEEVLRHLAEVHAGPGRSLAEVAARTASSLQGDSVVVITTDAAPPGDLLASTRHFEESTSGVLVGFERRPASGPSTPPPMPPAVSEAFDLVVAVPADRPFSRVWEEAMVSRVAAP